MTAGDLERELEALHQASFGWALACCRRDREEAADVLQSVYLKVLEGKAKFDGRSSLKTWLFATIRRTAAEGRRRRWVRALALGRWAARRPDPPPAGDAEASMSEADEDLTIAEASEVLRISEGSARTHYARGKERLRQRLGARGRP